jgi:hypothetical protein
LKPITDFGSRNAAQAKHNVMRPSAGHTKETDLVEQLLALGGCADADRLRKVYAEATKELLGDRLDDVDFKAPH